MTTWGIFWVCLFIFIAIDSVTTTIARYKAYKYTIDHQNKVSNRQIKNIIE